MQRDSNLEVNSATISTVDCKITDLSKIDICELHSITKELKDAVMACERDRRIVDLIKAHYITAHPIKRWLSKIRICDIEMEAETYALNNASAWLFAERQRNAAEDYENRYIQQQSEIDLSEAKDVEFLVESCDFGNCIDVFAKGRAPTLSSPDGEVLRFALVRLHKSQVAGLIECLQERTQ